MDFTVPAEHRVKLIESEKKDKYLDLGRELKKLWNMKVTFIPIVIGALGTDIKELIKGIEDLEIRGRVKTIQTTVILRLTRILRKVLETWGDCCHSNFSERPSANADVKNPQGIGIEKCPLLVMKSGKRHLTDGIELPNQDKIRKRDLQILRNLGGWHHQTSGNERQNSKRIYQEN